MRNFISQRCARFGSIVFFSRTARFAINVYFCSIAEELLHRAVIILLSHSSRSIERSEPRRQSISERYSLGLSWNRLRNPTVLVCNWNHFHFNLFVLWHR